MPHVSPDPLDDDVLEAMREMGVFLDITPSDAKELFQLAHRHAVKRLRASISVENLMTRTVITLTPDQSATEAAAILAGANISGAPVVRGSAPGSGEARGSAPGSGTTRGSAPGSGTTRGSAPGSGTTRGSAPGLQDEGGDEVLGVLSVKDFLVRLGLPRNAQAMALVSKMLSGQSCALTELDTLTVGDMMTAPARSVAPEAPAAEAARLMAAHAINRLPVLADGHLVGIVSRTDLANAFGNLLEDGQ